MIQLLLESFPVTFTYVDLLLPVGVEGLQRASISHGLALNSYPIPFNSAFLQNLLYPFFPSLSESLGLFPCILACQAILGYLSSPYSYNVPKTSQLY